MNFAQGYSPIRQNLGSSKTCLAGSRGMLGLALEAFVVLLLRSVKLCPALMAAMRALGSVWDSKVAVHGWIVADAFSASGALGFASAAVGSVVFAGGS